MCTILEENSTPIVWLERTRPVSEGGVLVGGVHGGGRERRGDGGRVTFGFYEAVEEAGSIRVSWLFGVLVHVFALIANLLASAAGSQQHNLGQVIIHTPQLLRLLSNSPAKLKKCPYLLVTAARCSASTHSTRLGSCPW